MILVCKTHLSNFNKSKNLNCQIRWGMYLCAQLSVHHAQDSRSSALGWRWMQVRGQQGGTGFQLQRLEFRRSGVWFPNFYSCNSTPAGSPWTTLLTTTLLPSAKSQKRKWTEWAKPSKGAPSGLTGVALSCWSHFSGCKLLPHYLLWGWGCYGQPQFQSQDSVFLTDM